MEEIGRLGAVVVVLAVYPDGAIQARLVFVLFSLRMAISGHGIGMEGRRARHDFVW